MEEAKQETLINDEASSKDKDKELGSQEDEVKESKPSSSKSKACSRHMSKRLVMVLLLLSIVAILLSTVVTISFSSFYNFDYDETSYAISIKPKRRVIPKSSKFVGVWELTGTSDGNLPDKTKYGSFLFHFEQYEEVNADEDKDVHRHRRPHHLLKLSAKIGPNTLSAPVRVFPEPRRGQAVDIEVGPVSSTHNQESEELEKLDSTLKEYLPQMTYTMDEYEPYWDYKNGRLVHFSMRGNEFSLRLEPFDNVVMKRLVAEEEELNAAIAQRKAARNS